MEINKKKADISKRIEFLSIYNDFTKWLHSLGFRTGHYWKESSTPNDYLYEHYSKHIDDLWGVEHYVHDVVKLSIRFLRDRNEHKFMFIDDIGSFSEVYNIKQTKELILKEVRKLRDEKIYKLNNLLNI